MARPSFKPTGEQRKTVRAMVAYGVPLDQVASVIGIDRKTLSKHFPEEIANAATEANAKVAQALYRQAVEHGHVTAQIFWLKTKASWVETSKLEHTSPDGSMTPRNIDASKLSDAALAELMNARRTEDQ